MNFNWSSAFDRSDRFKRPCDVYTTEFRLRCLTQKHIYDALPANTRVNRPVILQTAISNIRDNELPVIGFGFIHHDLRVCRRRAGVTDQVWIHLQVFLKCRQTG